MFFANWAPLFLSYITIWQCDARAWNDRNLSHYLGTGDTRWAAADVALDSCQAEFDVCWIETCIEQTSSDD